MKKGQKVIEAHSAGGVIYRWNNSVPEIAVIIHSQGKIKSLPKGEIGENETPEETAIREVREETGLTGKIIEKIDNINYWFYSKEDNAKVHKYVHYFLMEFVEGDINDHDWEVEEVVWVPIDRAGEVLSFKNEREVVSAASEKIRLRTSK